MCFVSLSVLPCLPVFVCITHHLIIDHLSRAFLPFSPLLFSFFFPSFRISFDFLFLFRLSFPCNELVVMRTMME